MEQITLEKIGEELVSLREVVEEMKEIILGDSLEVSDEVIADIERSRNAPEEDFTSHEDVMAKFCK